MTLEQVYNFLNKTRPNGREVFRHTPKTVESESDSENREWLLAWLKKYGKDYSIADSTLYGVGWVAIELRRERVIVETQTSLPSVFSYSQKEEIIEEIIKLSKELDKDSFWHRWWE